MSDFFATIGMVVVYSMLFSLLQAVVVFLGAPDTHTMHWVAGAFAGFATCTTRNYLRYSQTKGY